MTMSDVQGFGLIFPPQVTRVSLQVPTPLKVLNRKYQHQANFDGFLQVHVDVLFPGFLPRSPTLPKM